MKHSFYTLLTAAALVSALTLASHAFAQDFRGNNTDNGTGVNGNGRVNPQEEGQQDRMEEHHEKHHNHMKHHAMHRHHHHGKHHEAAHSPHNGGAQ